MHPSAQRITASAARAERSDALVRCEPKLGGVFTVPLSMAGRDSALSVDLEVKSGPLSEATRG